VVVLEGAMEVEVILAEVREGERGEPDAVETAELGAVRGRLERAAAIAAVEHLAERALKVDRLRRRPHRRPALAADQRLDRPEEAGASTGRGEDRAQQVGRRGLAVRAGDACDLELS